MPEYVDREAIKKYPIRLNSYDKKNGNYHFVLGIESVMEYIDCLPTTDVQEVKHGKWIKNKPNTEAMQEFYKQGLAKTMSETNIYWTCSCCNSWGTPAHKYCQNCGAKMNKEVIK